MVGRVESALKGRGMWERTLMLVTSDNGGPATHESNAPLRGFKGTDFDGGVRVASFVVGGALPTAMRGHKTSGLIHMCDWYATFAALAGVHNVADSSATKLGLPDVDSINVWPLLSGATHSSPRVEAPLSTGMGWKGPEIGGHGGSGYVVSCPSAACHKSVTPAHALFKLVRAVQNDCWRGCGAPGKSVNCNTGCLFNLDDDPEERNNLAQAHPELLAALQARALEIDATAYQSRGVFSMAPGATNAARSKWSGFFGPWLTDAELAKLPHLPVAGSGYG